MIYQNSQQVNGSLLTDSCKLHLFMLKQTSSLLEVGVLVDNWTAEVGGGPEVGGLVDLEQ